MNILKSQQEYQRACQVIAGGVNSPVRAFKSVGMNPLFIDSAKGSQIIDIDGNSYIDYVNSWGALPLGHAYPTIVEAIQKAAEKGTSYGAPTRQESEMAELITGLMPSVEMVRMVNSGTEATMSAIRLARAFTGKNKIIKFAGCYHGHGDSFLIKAGSGATTLGMPDSLGITANTAGDTLVAEYNDFESVKALFEAFGKDIAAVIIEPVAANMGLVLPENNFLKKLRKITEQNNALLIFDEVISGFRLGIGGCQEYYKVKPDLTTLGKIIGGGLPVGAYGGKREIMEMLAPIGAVYQAGTLSGNPIAMAAGIEMLKTLKNNPSIYLDLESKTQKLAKGLEHNLQKTGIKGIVHQIGSLLTLFFTDLDKITDYNTALQSNKTVYAKYFKNCLESGVYLPPSQFEAMFVSSAHTTNDIDKTLEISYLAMSKL